MIESYPATSLDPNSHERLTKPNAHSSSAKFIHLGSVAHFLL
jgi:hypothetical protein